MLSQQVQDAISNRNDLWANNPSIPKWVDFQNTALDQFFTKPEVATYCFNNLKDIIQQNGDSERSYRFIEPSAGNGAFYNILPRERRIGIDIMPFHQDFIQTDFLSWSAKSNGLRYVTVGNPPFGYRAWLALAFINHAAKFSDYVGMILPMAFQSDGKGSPKHRVEGLELLHTEYLPSDSFTDVHGKSVKVNGLWQVWKKGVNKLKQKKTCKRYLDLFTVDQRKERLCGQERMHEADFFLQRTFYRDPPHLVKDFSDVKYVCGYGLVFKENRKEILSLLNNTDWRSYSNLAAHNCRHISMYHIEKVLTDAGFSDG